MALENIFVGKDFEIGERVLFKLKQKYFFNQKVKVIPLSGEDKIEKNKLMDFEGDIVRIGPDYVMVNKVRVYYAGNEGEYICDSAELCFSEIESGKMRIYNCACFLAFKIKSK